MARTRSKRSTKKCVKGTTKKYTRSGRKVPRYSAKKCKGLKRKGIRGKKFVSRKVKGSYKWVPVKSKRKASKKSRKGKRKSHKKSKKSRVEKLSKRDAKVSRKFKLKPAAIRRISNILKKVPAAAKYPGLTRMDITNSQGQYLLDNKPHN